METIRSETVNGTLCWGFALCSVLVFTLGRYRQLYAVEFAILGRSIANTGFTWV